MSVQAKLKLIAEVKDTSSHTLVKSSLASRTFEGTGDIDTTLTASSTPVLENIAVFVATFTAGTVTIDLTALVHADGDTRSAAGKKLRFIHIFNPTGNGTIVVTKGASNGHSPVGSTFTMPVPADGCFLWYVAAAGADVTNSSNDTIDVTGTGTQSFYVKLGWG